MIYIRPASISWTHCIHSVSCSFCFWQGSARTSHFCGASLHEISGRFQVVSGCFKRQRAWERSFPTKAPLAQSDPQLQDGLKARMQKCRHDSQKTCTKDGVMMSCSFLGILSISPPLSSQKKWQALREKLPASVSLIDDFCAQPAQASEITVFGFGFEITKKSKTKCLSGLHCVCEICYTMSSLHWFLQIGSQASQEEESCDEGEPPVNYRAKKQSGDHLIWKATCQGATRGHWSTLRSQARHAETCRCPVIR